MVQTIDIPDLNCVEEDGEVNESNEDKEAAKNLESENFGVEELEKRLAVGEVNESNEDKEAAKNLESENFGVEELEKRLAVGEIVKDEHAAYALYCEYGRVKGFSVRKSSNVYTRKHDFLIGKWFVCSCEGVKDEKRSFNRIPDYQKKGFRCGCEAKLKIGRSKGEPWRVVVFHIQHNHELYAPDEAHLLRSSKRMTESQRLLFNTIVSAGVPPAKAFEMMQNMAHGSQNLGFTEREAFDEHSRKRKQSVIDGGDAIGVVQHLRKKTNTVADFYWNMEVEDDMRFMNLFFRDSQCLIDYDCFGDVISFDTTYKTNKYGLICAPFVGINHHKSNALFGFAILSNETQETFEWLFHTFLESMGGKQPKVVFTDQCQAMMNAIQVVFPSSQHRLCQWHINQNAPSHFGPISNKNTFFQYLWAKCMTNCESEEEFESIWDQMMVNYNLGGNDWFQKMYRLRHKWAAVFSKHIFTAGLLATSRSEGTNSNFNLEISGAKSSLLDCVVGYEKVLSIRRTDEKTNDSRDRHTQPALFAQHNPLLKQVAGLYTHKIFDMFQVEFKDSYNFSCVEESSCLGSSLRVFHVASFKESSCERGRIVQFDNQTFDVTCSCYKMESFGIFCSHIFKVFSHVNQRFIPDKYILKRWTKSAKVWVYNEPTKNINIKVDNTDMLQLTFVNQCTRKIHDLATRIKCYEDHRNMVKEAIESVTQKIEDWLHEMRSRNMSGELDANKKNCLEVEQEILVCDPPLSKSRGITNIHKRHWEIKRKRQKTKSETSKLIVGRGLKRMKQKEQTSSELVSEFLPTGEPQLMHQMLINGVVDNLPNIPVHYNPVWRYPPN